MKSNTHDDYFGRSRGWYYKTALGEIKMVAARQRGSRRGVRLVVHDTVCDYIRRSMGTTGTAATPSTTAELAGLHGA